MTHELSGVYFSETVSTIDSDIAVDEEEEVCFIVQTSTAIPTLDNQLKYYTNIGSFKTATNNKGLTKTVAFMERTLALAGKTTFYVYSVKTDTQAGFQEAVTCSTDIKEIRKIIYYEETASSNNNTIADKMAALTTACHTTYTYGGFRIAYVIPAATIEAAVAGAENVSPSATVVSTFTSLLTGEGDGRLAIMVPDASANVMSTIISTPFDEDPGKYFLNGTVGELTYQFTREQMKTLLNLGVIFIRPRRRGGVINYKLEGGITTAFKSDKADGTLSARQTADELLHQCDLSLEEIINDKEITGNVNDAQTVCDDVIAEFVKNEYVTQAGTQLKAVDAGDMKFTISGKIQTIKPLRTIEVNTTIN